jgi:hypothetical protein
VFQNNLKQRFNDFFESINSDLMNTFYFKFCQNLNCLLKSGQSGWGSWCASLSWHWKEEGDDDQCGECAADAEAKVQVAGKKRKRGSNVSAGERDYASFSGAAAAEEMASFGGVSDEGKEERGRERRPQRKDKGGEAKGGYCVRVFKRLSACVIASVAEGRKGAIDYDRIGK